MYIYPGVGSVVGGPSEEFCHHTSEAPANSVTGPSVFSGIVVFNTGPSGHFSTFTFE